MKKASAVAHPNIALVKYWGKRDAALHLPTHGSLSLTVGAFSTRTTVDLEDAPGEDELSLNGRSFRPGSREYDETVGRFLGLVRRKAGFRGRARIVSENDFPTAAGLASSSSAYAALAVALNEALGLGLGVKALSVLARQGSGSATRSLFGGFAEWLEGKRADGGDSHGTPLAGEAHWPEVRLVFCLTDPGEKKVKSRSGMERSARSSPLFASWVATARADLDVMRRGILARDLELVGETAEQDCLAMHATMLAARPPLLYWNAATVEILHAVWSWREEGLKAWFTLDAGPQVKILCLADTVDAVRERLSTLPVPVDVRVSGPGPGARLTDEHLF